MIALSLVLAGCHVFEAVSIDCASDEKCAHPDLTDADTDTDSDTDADTDADTDTGPLVSPTAGWIVSEQVAGGNKVVVYNPDGTSLTRWTGLGDAAGPVAYDPVTGEAVLAYDGLLEHLDSDGSMTRSTVAFPYVYALEYRGGVAYVADGGNIVTWDSADESSQSAFDSALSGLEALALGTDDTIFASDTDRGSPDLYKWTLHESPTTAYADFDGSAARARILFPGPDGAPYSCSSAGAIYAIADLAAGNAAYTVFYDGGLTDVSACGYDPGDATWLLFSPTAGVIRLDAQGRGEVVLAPSGDFTLVRGSFY